MRAEPCIVTVSAPGKRFPSDIKVTDMFYDLYRNKGDLCSYGNIFSEITARILSVCADGSTRNMVSKELSYIYGAVLRSEDPSYCASRGEYLSAKIFAHYAGYKFIDATDVLEKRDGKIRLRESVCSALKCVVVPGFYYGSYGGHIATLGRGGSDLTGAVLARDLRAREYINYTDSDGIMTAPPAIAEGAVGIAKIGYDLLCEATFYGADVIQYETAETLRGSGVKLIVRNVFSRYAPDTVVSPKSTPATIVTVCAKGSLRYSAVAESLNLKGNGYGKTLIVPVSSEYPDLCERSRHALLGMDYTAVPVTGRKYCKEAYVVEPDDARIAASLLHSALIRKPPCGG